ncbi:hypothetical protein SAMN02744778_02095 [Pantoea sp. GL120224-02]|jgi:hypothetical protein|nr:hypothetical protein SAMN02744778_02095 [Pantoea sp. GL120224-02]
MQVIIQPDVWRLVFYAANQVSMKDFTPVTANIL